jgi:hypothetical protein
MALIDEIVNPLESVSKFSPDRFRATVTNGFGLASPSRFEVEFPGIGGMTKVDGGTVKDKSSSDDRNLTCSAAQIPGKQLNLLSRGIGINQQQVVNGNTFGEAQFTFYLPNSYVMREYFHRWMQCITSQDNPNGVVQYVGYYKNYVKPVRVRQYTRNARRAYTVDLIDSFPTNIGVVELNSQLQSQASEVTVTMAFRTYMTKQEKSSLVH